MSVRLLPLFPLPLVLLPGTPLPLHIFEPRYRRMLEDVLDGDRRFGILFKPDGLGEGELPVGAVGCVAHIDETETLVDGRSNIIVHGAERFALHRFVVSPAPYHVGEVSDYADADEPAAALDPVVERVRDLFRRAAAAARAIAGDPAPAPELPDDPALVSFAAAGYIELEAATRQALLESRSAGGRLRVIEEVLAGAVGPLEVRAAVRERAKSNGRGPHAPA